MHAPLHCALHALLAASLGPLGQLVRREERWRPVVTACRTDKEGRHLPQGYADLSGAESQAPLALACPAPPARGGLKTRSFCTGSV